ncbi:MAG: oligosaccharide flippase family protein [Salinibacter sp.]
MFDALRVPSWRSLSRGALVSFAIRVGGTGLLYGLHVVLARWMNAGGYGTYVFAISWTSFLAQFGKLGLPSAALRFVPEYRTNQESGLLSGFLQTSRGFILVGTSGLALLVSGVAHLVPTGNWALTPLLVGFALTPLMGLFSFEREVLRALDRFGWSYAPNYVLRPLAIGLLAGGLYWGTGFVSPLSVLLCTGAVLLALMLAQQWRIRSALNAFSSAMERRPRRWLRVALPLLLTSGSQLIVSKTDIFLIGILINSEEVGIYFAAMRTAQVVTFFTFAADAVAAPQISRLYHGEEGDLQDTVSSLAHWYFWPTLIGALGLILLAEPILSLFGAEFTAGVPILMVLVIAFVVGAAMGPQLYLLNLTGHERTSAYIFGACATLNILLNFIGIYYYGVLGAAVATTTTLTIRSLWIRWRVVILTGITPSIWGAIRTELSRS